MNSFERFNESVRKFRKYFQFIGQDIFVTNDQFRYGPFFCVTNTVLLLAIVVYFIDSYKMIDLENAIRILQLCSMHAVLEINIKYNLYTELRPLCTIIIPYFETIYRENIKSDDKYFAICQKFSRRTEFLLKSAAILSFGTLFMTYSAAMFESYMTMNPFYYFYFPMIYDYTYVQLTSLNLFTAIGCLIITLITPAGDVLILLIIVNLAMLAEIIAFELNEFSQRLLQKLTDGIEIRRRWLKYMQFHQKFNEYAIAH